MTHDMPAAKSNAASSRVACHERLAGSVPRLGWQQVAVARALPLDSRVDSAPDRGDGDLAGAGERLACAVW